MAMTTCGECGNGVSTEAASCPKCGAPPARFRPVRTVSTTPRSAKLLIAAFAALAVIYMVGTASKNDDHSASPVASAQPSEPAPVEPPAPPPRPAHNFTIEQDGEYGYEPAVSDDDRKAGTAVKPMIMVRYLGTKEHLTRFAVVDAGVRTVFTCNDACDIVKSTVYLQGEQVRQETMRVAPGSIIGAVVDDIENGQLNVYGAAR